MVGGGWGGGRPPERGSERRPCGALSGSSGPLSPGTAAAAAAAPPRQPAWPSSLGSGGSEEEGEPAGARAAAQGVPAASMGLGGRMARRGPRPAGGRLLRSSEVPPGVAESFILSGYRCPGYTLAQCLRSAFRPTNETGNFWTHFVAVFVFAFHSLQPLGGEAGGPPPPPAPFYYPLWSYCLGVCGLLVASSLAHLLSSMSLLVRELCFYVDYGTISAYTVGSALAYFYYIRPRGGGGGGSPPPPPPPPPSCCCCCCWRGPWLEALYVPAACLTALFCTLACCSSRRQWPRHRYLIRTLVFLLPFGVVSIPVFRKLWGAGAGAGGQGTGRFFWRHCLWLLASGVFNVSKIPERFSPGKFDIWGHSHQWFHCCTFMSILDELHMIRGEMRELAAAAGLPLLPHAPTLLSTFGVMLLVLASLAGIVGWFGLRAYRASQPQSSSRRKGD